jgi:alpha-tubulin suppressor-like RCC1 family protein
MMLGVWVRTFVPHIRLTLSWAGVKQKFIVHVSAGETHSAAVDDKGTLYVWGDGSDGKLGSKYPDDQCVDVCC